MVLSLIKDLKISFQVYNFFNRKRLIHNVPAYKKYGLRKKYFSSISSKDFPVNSGQDASLNNKTFESLLKGDPEFQQLSSTEQENMLQWSTKGYLILPQFFDPTLVDQINKEVDEMVGRKKAHFRYSSNKIMFAIKHSSLLRNLAKTPRLKAILKLLLQKEAVLFQSINFLRGSEQKTHSDSIHMSSYPEGNLIAVWIALEDIDESNGTIHYYEGSHHLPYYYNKDYNNQGNRWRIGDKPYDDYEDFIAKKIKELNLTKTIFRAKKGDVFIWHANLLHGGEPHINQQKTRKSMVFHYFGEGAICYHEVTQRPALIDRY